VQQTQKARDCHHDGLWGHAHRDGWDYLCTDEMKNWAEAIIAAACIATFIVFGTFFLAWGET